ncbi:MAG: aminoglycoside phosphotransferase family protein [Planctomycetota bacterium]
MDLYPTLARRIGRLLGAAPLRFDRIEGGCTPALRLRAHLPDGSTAFVKAATDADTATWLRHEHRVYGHVEAPFLPRLRGFDPAELPVLAIEDLSDAHWPPPWTAEHVDDVLRALDEMAASTPPSGLPPMEQKREMLCGWRRVAADPRPFLSLGVASHAWLERALPPLLEADEQLVLGGDALCHFDTRSDNLCLRDRQAVLVDWNWACVGNPRLDRAFFLPSLHADGGPAPDVVLPDAADVAPTVAGYFASTAGQPPLPTAPRVRPLQLLQLRHALPWAARVLGLPPPST